MIRHRLLATKCFAIETTAVKSMPCSIWYAAWRTISLHWYSSIAESAINHWIPCFSASVDPSVSSILDVAVDLRVGARTYWAKFTNKHLMVMGQAVIAGMRKGLMDANVPLLLVRVPDPGSIAALDVVLEREVVEKWQDFKEDGALKAQQRIVVASARK